jgi:hypothetical protein
MVRQPRGGLPGRRGDLGIFALFVAAVWFVVLPAETVLSYASYTMSPAIVIYIVLSIVFKLFG